eukprot:CAMPEP_0170198732 /NCGR_PEP_ID=MMETSP0040_2-20121228/68945_1 /TAXON_ID=641309 /ORGANISM="Lotharella oceanica, Strain CCMP622" /LENGTH=35 /DNA_ID= /DNA_START= /DNA_END= /DNA_ORIENTATION=
MEEDRIEHEVTQLPHAHRQRVAHERAASDPRADIG